MRLFAAVLSEARALRLNRYNMRGDRVRSRVYTPPPSSATFRPVLPAPLAQPQPFTLPSARCIFTHSPRARTPAPNNPLAASPVLPSRRAEDKYSLQGLSAYEAATRCAVMSARRPSDPQEHGQQQEHGGSAQQVDGAASASAAAGSPNAAVPV